MGRWDRPTIIIRRQSDVGNIFYILPYRKIYSVILWMQLALLLLSTWTTNLFGFPFCFTFLWLFANSMKGMLLIFLLLVPLRAEAKNISTLNHGLFQNQDNNFLINRQTQAQNLVLNISYPFRKPDLDRYMFSKLGQGCQVMINQYGIEHLNQTLKEIFSRAKNHFDQSITPNNSDRKRRQVIATIGSFFAGVVFRKHFEFFCA